MAKIVLNGKEVGGTIELQINGAGNYNIVSVSLCELPAPKEIVAPGPKGATGATGATGASGAK